MPIFSWNDPLGSLIYLKRSLVFHIPLVSLFLCIVHLRRHSYLSYLSSEILHSVEYIFLSLSPLAFTPLLFCIIYKPPQITTLSSGISFSLGLFWSLPPVQCYTPLSTVLQALCIPDIIPWIYLSPPLCDYMGFDFCHTWMASSFPHFQFKSLFNSNLNFALRCSWSEPQSTSGLILLTV